MDTEACVQGLIRFSSRIWLREVDLGAYNVRGAVLLGDKAAVVFDSLSRPGDMADVVPLLAGRPLTVVYSHADWDHVWGTAGLPLARVVAHEAASGRFAGDVPETLARMRAEEPGRWDDVVLVPPTDTFCKELSLDLGGLTLHLRHLPGHTPDALVGFVPEEGLLLAGDTVETPFPCLNDGSPLDMWIEELARWSANEAVRQVIPAHGRIGGRELLGGTLAYLRTLQAGGTFDLPEGTTRFYRDAHRDNLRFARGG